MRNLILVFTALFLATTTALALEDKTLQGEAQPYTVTELQLELPYGEYSLAFTAPDSDWLAMLTHSDIGCTGKPQEAAIGIFPPGSGSFTLIHGVIVHIKLRSGAKAGSYKFVFHKV